MLQALDARREKKIEVEQVALRYKLQALQVKTVGERSQVHSQYFQTARAIREKKMEDVGAQWYQIQRDRRNWNGNPPGKSILNISARTAPTLLQTLTLVVSQITHTGSLLDAPNN